MSSESEYTGSNFRLLSAEQLSGTTVRIRYSHDPIAISSAGAYDALNPDNYDFSGPVANGVGSIMPVTDDPQGFDLYLESLIVEGQWTVTVSNVKSDTNITISAPVSVVFDAVRLNAPRPLAQGALNDSQEKIIRSFLSPALRGSGWDAVMAALAVGDAYNRRTAQAATDQLYKCTASGIYLDRILSDDGFPRPINIGMSDRLYRNLGIKTGATKLVLQPILEALEAYYGDEATRAYSMSIEAEPYALMDGDQLLVQIDEGQVTPISFERDDFGRMGEATAAEVAAAITRGLRSLGDFAYSVAFKDATTGLNYVRIFSGALGLSGAVRIKGGRAQNQFKFPTEVETTQVIGTSWDIVPATAINGILAGRVRISWSGGTDPQLQKVIDGNYVNIFGSPFLAENRGAFEILATTASYFEIVNILATAQSGVVQVAADDIVFYESTKKSIQSIARMSTAVQGSPSSVDIILPTTTDAVERGINTGAYLHQEEQLTVIAGSREADGTTTLTTDEEHGLSAGDWVVVDDLEADLTSPGALASYTNTGAVTTYSRSRTVLLPNGLVLVCGGENSIFVDTSSAYLYDPEANTWSPAGVQTDIALVPASGQMNVARAGHTATLLNDGTVLVVGGHATNKTAEIYDYESDTWSPANSMSVARTGHSACLMADGRVFVVGGTTSVTAEIYDPATSTWTTTTAPSISRTQHAAVTLRDGRILVCGGFDPNALTNLSSAEVFNPTNSSWTVAGSMSAIRVSPGIAVTRRGTSGDVYVFGGYNDTLSLATVESFNPATMAWTARQSMLSTRAIFDAVTLADGTIFLGFGKNISTLVAIFDAEIYDVVNNSTTATLTSASVHVSAASLSITGADVLIVGGPAVTPQLWTKRVAVFAGGGLNGLFRVVDVPSSTEFSYVTETTEVTTLLASGVVTPVKHSSNGIQGPFIFEEKTSPAITAISTTLNQNVSKGQTYKILTLTDVSEFPDEEGYLLMGFGTDDQMWPVKYLARISNTQLLMDPNFVFPAALATGISVTLLLQRGSWSPLNADTLGSFYLTASSAGRIAASDTIDELVGAGLNINKIVVYPGDRGLGGEGLPATGAQKLSDKVGIWGSDDITKDIDKAREE